MEVVTLDRLMECSIGDGDCEIFGGSIDPDERERVRRASIVSPSLRAKIDE